MRARSEYDGDDSLIHPGTGVIADQTLVFAERGADIEEINVAEFEHAERPAAKLKRNMRAPGFRLTGWW